MRRRMQVLAAGTIAIAGWAIAQGRAGEGPPSAAASAYLDQAIAILKQHHINSTHADWPRLTAEARAGIAGAQTPGDTYPAIRRLVTDLGVRHSFFMPPPTQAEIDAAKQAGATGVTPGVEMPTAQLIDGRVGEVRLPMLDSVRPGGTERSATYPQILQTELRKLDAAPLCGWIVDLRENGGGNMWPMLKGLDPLLGASPFGFFVGSGGGVQPWIRSPAGIFPVPPQPGPPVQPAFALTHAATKLAVLIGPHTASSGEMTALALIGRPGVRTFGANSAGFLSGNIVMPMSDGAHLVVTEVLVRDRTGRDYSDFIHPDVATDTPEEDAKAWIEQQCGT